MWKWTVRVTLFFVVYLLVVSIAIAGWERPFNLLYAVDSATGGNKFDIYLYSVVSGENKRIATVDQMGTANWSPGDFDYVDLLDTNSQGLRTLRRYDAVNDIYLSIADDVAYDPCLSAFSASPSGFYIMYMAGEETALTGHLYSLETAAAEPLPDVGADAMHRISWSIEDGYVAYPSKSDPHTINIVDIYTREIVKVVESLDGRIRWLYSHSFVYADPALPRRVVLVNLDDGSEQRYPGSELAAITRSGRYLVTYRLNAGSTETLLIDAERNNQRVLDDIPLELSSDTWSGSDKYLVYSVNERDDSGLPATGIITFPQMSVRAIADVYVHPYMISWSPEQDIVAVALRRQSPGQDSVEIINMETGQTASLPLSVNWHETYSPLQWSDFLPYLSIEAEGGIVLFNTDTWSALPPIAESGDNPGAARWSIAGEYLAFIGSRGSQNRLYVMDMTDFSVTALRNAWNTGLMGWHNSYTNDLQTEPFFCRLG